MKKVLLGSLALGLTAFFVPTAAHAAGDTIHGGCFFNTDANAVATNGTNSGVIGDLSATVDGNNQPTGATVSCKIQVNGSDAANTQIDATGVGVQAGQKQIAFDSPVGATVDLCQRVVYADSTDTGWTCQQDTELQIPPQQVIDALNTIFDTLNAAEIQHVDPVVCPVLVSLHGSYGPITIASDGDVFVPDPLNLGLNPFYDCPPYQTV